MSWVMVVAGLAGGVALLLFGLDQLTSVLREVAGDRLRALLGRVSANRWLGAIVGMTATAVMQSSSAVTVLIVGFVAAGLMTLVGSLGVILGSNVGTTITAQVVAFDVVEWALGIVALGFATMTFARTERLQGWGRAILSLGLVFLGMGAMGTAMEPLRELPEFVDIIAGLSNPLVGALIGVIFTALVQSSSATTVLAIVLASQGLLTLESGIAVVIGANIGSSVTAVIASLGRPADARRAAIAHVLFNVAAGVVWLTLLTPLAELAVAVSPTRADLAGTERLAAEAPRQLANAHTIFNVATVAVFIWFLEPMSRLLHRLVADQPEEAASDPVFLDPKLLETPAIALSAVAREVGRLGTLVLAMLRAAPGAVLSGPRSELRQLETSDSDVDVLYDHIIRYLAELAEKALPEEDGRRVLALLEAVNGLESIADLVETNLVALGSRRLDVGVQPADSTRHLLESAFATVTGHLEDALQAVVEGDPDTAQRVLASESEISGRLADMRIRQASRISPYRQDRRIMYAIESDIIDVLKQISYLTHRIVRSIQPRT
ncbi:MAG: Na/Pi cotransporter family protein [Acidimicrobiia bacterium]